MNGTPERLPLRDIKILDASTMLAAPWSSTFLADYGAEVIKIEHPEFGDHARRYGKQKDGNPLLWKTLNRNKKGITLNLSKPEGQDLFKRLVAQVDVVVENYRPGTFEKWNLGWDVLSAINPSLIMLRTTGFGQTGPYATRAGFGTVAEGMSGFTSVNGSADGPPTLPGMALADGVSGAFGALSLMIALHERTNNPERKGQCIDISLYEPLMRLLEPHIVAYDQLGIIANRVGNGSLSVAPRNAYQTKEGKWVAISGAAQTIAENLFKAIGREELIDDPRFVTNDTRLKHVQELDAIIGGWIRERELSEVLDILNGCGAVVGPMYDVSQLDDDPHFRYRESFVTMQDEDFGEMRVPNVVAKFSRTPGKVISRGPKQGEHNDEIYQDLLSLSTEEIEALKLKKII
ncbi:CaiB/BaiF CoA transferase family protein [Brevibacillus invocatus]|uniref:CaiB/BaiF CoA transferase family protein n=1 Tax=Brevibacillus invocatus TaxID=173959 RepID=UPI00203AEDFB|nr:CoA transferase [Brevibacillus invocatus]MCM3080753.1 CoA transferase [Brevibacillus invocatus]MCM3430826.1 CoA transferase [Brevibacillus invocatus]